MLTDEDIKKLLGVIATKDDIKELREDMSGLKESVQELTISIDKLVGGLENLKQEYFVITHSLKRHERWIEQIAEKVGIRLEN